MLACIGTLQLNLLTWSTLLFKATNNFLRYLLYEIAVLFAISFKSSGNELKRLAPLKDILDLAISVLIYTRQL
jgi:hypothetical protein